MPLVNTLVYKVAPGSKESGYGMINGTLRHIRCAKFYSIHSGIQYIGNALMWMQLMGTARQLTPICIASQPTVMPVFPIHKII